MGFRKAFEGKELSNVHNELPAPVSLLVWLWGGVMAAFLWPFHVLGKKLVYAKIHATIGISKGGISGGGSLPLHVDMFFEASMQFGHAIRGTEIKITDADTGADVPVGSKGIVKVRGPQVMKGYYKNPFATIRILDNDGWIETGDIGWIVPCYSTGPSRLCGGMLVLEGRAKDTIVLTTGENVEPSELEEAAKRSNIIQQIVVVGQDRRRLGALIVPDKEQLLSAARQKSDDSITAIDHEVCYKLVRDELLRWTSDCSFQVGPFLLLDEPFTVDNGLLTPTLKIRRDMVASRYNQEIEQLYK